MKKLIRVSLLLATFMTFIGGRSNAVTITYNGLTPNDNALFQPPALFGGYWHTCVGGWVGSSGSITNAIFMECWASQYALGKASLQISYPFLANHYYKITVNAAKRTSTQATPKIQPYLDPYERPASAIGANSNFDETNANGSSPVQMVNSNTYADYEFTIQPNSNRPVLVLTAFPEDAYLGELQTISVHSITIDDITSTMPIFQLTPSTVSVGCGSTVSQTFNIINVNNIPGVTWSQFNLNYNYYNGWLLNGTQAPDVIPGNQVTLSTISCQKGGWIIGKVFIGNDFYYTNPVSVSVTTPDLTIYGPSTLFPTEVGYFDIQGITSTPINYNWPCTSPFVTWSSSIPTQSSFYNTSGTQFNSYFYAHNNISAPMDITVSADVTMCGVNKHLTKGIRINRPRSQFSKKVGSNGSESLEMSLMPNPSNGKFKVTLNNYVENADVIITALDGRLIDQFKINGIDANVDISGATSGLYFIKVTNNGEVLSEKIIKQ